MNPVQNRGTFLWTVISKTCPRIFRSKIDFIESVTFQLRCRILSSFSRTVIKKLPTFFGPWVKIALSQRVLKNVDFFRVKRIHNSRPRRGLLLALYHPSRASPRRRESAWNKLNPPGILSPLTFTACRSPSVPAPLSCTRTLQ